MAWSSSLLGSRQETENALWIDPEALKGGKRTGRLDLFKDRKGNIYVKPKDGSGPGDPTGININDLLIR